MKKGKLVFVFLVIILLSMGIFAWEKSNLSKEERPKKVEENVEAEILKYNLDNIDADFLAWVDRNYPEALKGILVKLENNTYTKDDWYKLTSNSLNVLLDLKMGNYENKTNVRIIQDDNIVFSFIGDVSLADNYLVMPEYNRRGQNINGILDEAVINSLKESTVAVANNEFTVSTRGEPLKGKMFTFRAHPDRLKIYTEMGIDLVTLANNHTFDYGETAFMDLLTELDKINLPHIGAGKNLEEASLPFYFIINGRKIALVNANRSEKNILTPGATASTPGVLRCYDPTYFSNLIKEVKQNSDYVLALVHWGKEGSHTLENEQITSAKLYIESGADAIIGTHAHVLQGMEFYQNKLIAYNLGNFIFNDRTIETGILKMQIADDGSLKYYFEPCLQSNTFTKMLANDERRALLQKMENWSSNASLLETGEIVLKN